MPNATHNHNGQLNPEHVLPHAPILKTANALSTLAELERRDADLREIDVVCDSFEVAWRAYQSGQVSQPRIEDYVAAARHGLYDLLLRYLVGFELEQRRAALEMPSFRDYCKRFPRDKDLIGPVFLEQPDFASGRATIRIDGYEMGEEIDRGGMGVVYKASQSKTGLLVAIKVITVSEHPSREKWVRFNDEVRLWARVQHPNIVTIHGAGECDDGRPYLAMEYIDGGNLAKKVSGKPQSPQLAAEMVQTLAQAVHAAHKKGVIHRDLKPANVLVCKNGMLKITDFGLAKKFDGEDERLGSEDGLRTPLADAGSGTPAYMAPEQAFDDESAITFATDIFGLGAVLYELLTGQPLWAGGSDGSKRSASDRDYLERIRRCDITFPSHWQPGVDQYLEAICRRCLAKNPEDRYASAEALADDLGCWLCKKPIIACSVGRGERMWLWIQRETWKAALYATVFVGFLILLAGGIVSYLLTLEAKNDALWTATQLCEAYQKDYWRVAEVAPQSEGTSANKSAIENLEKLSRRYPKNLLIQRTLGLLYHIQGIYHEGEDDKAATEFHQNALSVREQLTTRDPRNPEYQRDHAASLAHLALVSYREAETEPTIARFKEARAIQEALIQELTQDPSLKTGVTDLLTCKRDLAKTLTNFGDFYRNRQHYPEAEAELQTAVKLWQELIQEVPGNREYRHDEARAHRSLGRLYLDQRKWLEARTSLDTARRLSEKLLGEFEQSITARIDLAEAHRLLGHLFTQDKKFKEARSHLDKALELNQALAQEHKKSGWIQRHLARTFYRRGLFFTNSKQQNEAATAFEQAQRLLGDRTSMEDKRLYRIVSAGFMTVRIKQERYREAVAIYPHAAAEDPRDGLMVEGLYVYALARLCLQNRPNQQVGSSHTSFAEVLKARQAADLLRSKRPTLAKTSIEWAKVAYNLSCSYATLHQVVEAAKESSDLADQAVEMLWESYRLHLFKDGRYLSQLRKDLEESGDLFSIRQHSRSLELLELLGPHESLTPLKR